MMGREPRCLRTKPKRRKSQEESTEGSKRSVLIEQFGHMVEEHLLGVRRWWSWLSCAWTSERKVEVGRGQEHEWEGRKSGQ